MILSSGDSNTWCSASDSSMVPRLAPIWPPVTALLSIRKRRILRAISSSSAKVADFTRAGVIVARSAARGSFTVIMDLFCRVQENRLAAALPLDIHAAVHAELALDPETAAFDESNQVVLVVLAQVRRQQRVVERAPPQQRRFENQASA